MKNTQLIQNAKTQEMAMWKRIAADLAKSSRRQRIVNLSRIAHASSEGETVIVPGKVLGSGDLTHKVTVVAASFSQSALDKLADAKCTVMTLEEFLAKNPKGTGRIIG